jgi:hypothetical protein
MKALNWNEVVRYLFYGVAAFMANRATNILDKLEANVNELNVKLAVVVNKTENSDWRIDRVEDRVSDVERWVGKKNHN